MRILFTFVGGSGHFHPLIPVAQAAEAAGHTVAVTGHPRRVAEIEAAGFIAFPTGPDDGRPPQRMPLLPLNAAREERDLRERFARRAAGERAPAILELSARWQPDLIVCDEVDFGAMIAAEKVGLPYASVLVIAAGSLVRKEIVAGPLAELRAIHGLPADPDLQMLDRYLVLSPCPPSLRDPAFPLPPTGHAIRPRPVEPGRHGAPPAWLQRLEGRSLVYCTLGTAFNIESGDLFVRLLAGLHDLPLEVLVTVGPHIDPAEFGPQPVHVHVELYVPQSLLLPHCRVMVSHAGSGSVIGALTHGVPMVLLPLGADQPLNAARCVQLGVARVLDAVSCTDDEIHAAVSAVLSDPAYRQQATRLQDEIAALPGPDHAVRLLEQLGTQRRPITSV